MTMRTEPHRSVAGNRQKKRSFVPYADGSCSSEQFLSWFCGGVGSHQQSVIRSKAWTGPRRKQNGDWV